jgi:hypothetical protein
MSPRRNWDSPTPFLACKYAPTPPSHGGGGGAHSPACEGFWDSQFRRLEKKLSTLPTLRSLPGSERLKRFRSEPEFLNFKRSPRIDSNEPIPRCVTRRVCKPYPTRFLASIDCLKTAAPDSRINLFSVACC